MAHYMLQFSYTREAWTALTKNPQDRTGPLRALVEKLGGRLISLYYAFGEYDGVAILEAPDQTAAAAGVLAALVPGHLKATKTTLLLTVEEAMKAMSKAGGLTYSGPK